jgi:hypothetical protein
MKRIDGYATADDFQRIFATEMGELFHLALLLMTDCEQAEQCLILAMKDCFNSSAVFKEWSRIWARRAVIRRAISLVSASSDGLHPAIPGQQDAQVGTASGEVHQEAQVESLGVLYLPVFERFVFVICGIERYSIKNCALLLCKSQTDVKEALIRAKESILFFEMQQCNPSDGAASASAYARSCIHRPNLAG